MTPTKRQKYLKTKIPEFLVMPEEIEKKMELTIKMLGLSPIVEEMLRSMCTALFHLGINRGVDMVDEISKGLHE